MGMLMIFDEKYACEFGVEESIMLQNLIFWVRKNKANNKHFYDGRYWTYNSAAAFTKLFPFWNRRKIARLLQSLVKQGAIYAGNYNENPIDRTLWYSVNEKIMEQAEAIGQIRPMDRSEPSNARVGSDQPIPYVNSDVNHITSWFDEFWKEYPRKQKRKDAAVAWRNIKWGKPSEHGATYQKIMQSLREAKKSEQWTKNGGQFIPLPTTWIHGERWEDEVVNMVSSDSCGYRRYGDAD